MSDPLAPGEARALLGLSADWRWQADSSLRIRSFAATRGSGVVDPANWIGEELPALLASSLGGEGDLAAAQVRAREPFTGWVVRSTGSDGHPAWLRLAGVPVHGARGDFEGYEGVASDVSACFAALEQAERMRMDDALTGFYNRSSFDERAQSLLQDAYAAGRACALLAIGLDRFRLLNGIYGHRIGDRILAGAAARVRAAVPSRHLLGRRGGAGIEVLLADPASEDEAIALARSLVAVLSRPENVDGTEIAVSASVGVALFPRDGADLESLADAAEAARLHALAASGGVGQYTSSLARRVELRVRLAQRLRRAFEARDFRLFYQPLVSLGDGRAVGAEVLLRWRDAELGEIPPSEFIPIAEESGLIVELGDWVLREACRQRRIWREVGLDPPPLAVNISSVQLRQPDCVPVLLSALESSGVSPWEIEVEVTETGLLDAAGGAHENLARLRTAGIGTALDDFGVGYSSLSHLRDLPIQRLKIDRSFTSGCLDDARTLTIVRAIVAMARELGLLVTAEGVETEEQAGCMRALGCDSAQGYLYARPMPAEDFLRTFAHKSP